MSANSEEPIEAKPLSVTTELEMELGKRMIYDSLTSMNDYAKFMIGFNGVLAGLYSGLLKFLPQEALQKVNPVILFVPVLAFVLSAIVFTVAYFPQKERISLERPSSILRAYAELMNRKKQWSEIGTIFFILSVTIMALILIFGI
jgi:hypothetical protein